MDSETAGLGECDEYHRVISKTFRSEEERSRFYNEYVKVKEFIVRKEEVKSYRSLGRVSGGFRRDLWKDIVHWLILKDLTQINFKVFYSLRRHNSFRDRDECVY